LDVIVIMIERTIEEWRA